MSRTKYIEDYFEVSEIYENSNNYSLDDAKFNSMIDEAITQNTILSKIQNYFQH